MNEERIYLDTFTLISGEKVEKVEEIPTDTLCWMRDVGAMALLRPLARNRREHGQTYGRIALIYNVHRSTALRKCSDDVAE